MVITYEPNSLAKIMVVFSAKVRLERCWDKTTKPLQLLDLRDLWHLAMDPVGDKNNVRFCVLGSKYYYEMF